MWRTSIGNRVLRGSEARLFAMGVLRLLDSLSEWSKEPGGSARAFYRLSRGQQLVTLSQVVEAMFRRSVETPVHTAANEAAIAAVFDGVRDLLEEDIENHTGEDGGPVRRLIRRILWRHFRALPIPSATADTEEEWDFSIEVIMDRILWDRDYEEDWAADTPEATVPELLQAARLVPEYFASVPAAAAGALADVLEDGIRAICDAIV